MVHRLVALASLLAFVGACGGGSTTSNEVTWTVASTPAQVVADGVATASLTATARRVDGSAVVGQAVSFEVTGTGNVLSASEVSTGDDGVASVTLTSTVVEAKTVTVRSAGAVVGTAVVTFVPGAPSLGLSGKSRLQVSATSPGVGDTVTVTATIKDALEHPIPGTTVTFTASAGHLSAATAATSATGVASVSLDAAAAADVVVAATVGGTDVYGSLAVAFIGAASSLTVVRQPDAGTAGAPLADLEVEARDAAGHLVPFPGPVIVALATAPTGAALGGTLSRPGTAAVVTFVDLILEKAGTYELEVASGALAVIGDPFVVAAGAPDPTRGSVTVASASATVDVTTSILVTVRDSFDNPVAGESVTLGATGDGNTLTPASAPTAADGTTSGGISSTVAGAKTVSAVVRSQTLTSTATITIDPGPAASIAFLTAPTTGIAGVTLGAVGVGAFDVHHNATAFPQGPVTISFVSAPAGATLDGTPSQTSTASTVSFTDLKVYKAGDYVLGAAAGTLTAATPTIPVGPGAPARLAFALQPATSVVAGAPISAAVAVHDAYDNLVPASTPDVTVALGGNALGLTLNGTKTRAAVAGVAPFSALWVAEAGTGYQLVAASSGLTSAASASFAVVAGAPDASLSGVAFSTVQMAPADGTSTIGLTITVRDAHGNPVAGELVTLTATGTGNSMTTPVNATDAAGQTTGAISSTKAEVKVVTARLGALELGRKATVTFTGGPVAKLVLTAAPNVGIAGVALTDVVVAALDATDNPAVFPDQVGVALLESPVGALLMGGAPRVATDATVTFTGMKVQKAGTYRLRAASGTFSVDTAPFDVTAATPSLARSGVAASASTAVVDEVVTLTATVRDEFDNLVPGATVTFSSNGTGDTLSAATTTSTNGQATGSFTSTKIGTKTVTGNVNGLGTMTLTNAVITVTAGTAAALVVTAQPTSGTAGVALADLVITAVDLHGNPTTFPLGGATVSLKSSPTGAALAGTKTLTPAGTSVTFTGLSVEKSGAYQLTVSSGLLSVDTTAFTVAAAAPAKLAFATALGPTVTAGAPMVFEVHELDQYGNLATSGVDAVQLAVVGATAPLHGTTSVNAVAGVASFSVDLRLADTGYQLEATSGALTLASSDVFDVVAAAPAKLVFAAALPGSVTAGAPMSFQVHELDQFDNLATSGSDAIQLAVSGGTPLFGATLPTAATSGVASFSGINVRLAGTGYQLQATSGTLSAALSSSFDVTPDAPAKLAFAAALPASVTAGVSLGTFTVHELDQFDNLATSGTDTIQLEVSGGAPTLHGATSAVAAGGVASFTGTNVQTAGAGYKLRATTGALTAGLSSAFDVTAAAPSQLAFAAALPTSVVAGVAIPFSVRELDPYGNLATTSTDTIVVAMVGGTPAVFGGASRPAASGVASFTDVNVHLVGTGYQLEATSGGLTAAQSSAFSVTSAPPAKLVFAGTALPGSITAGDLLAFEIHELDQFDNLATTGGDDITIAVSGGAAAAYGSIPTTAVSGVAVFNDVTVHVAGTGYELEATSGTLTAALSTAFAVNPAAPAKLSFPTALVTSVTAGVSLGTFTVRELDQFDNLATSGTDTIELAMSGGSPSLFGATSAIAAGGVATFTGTSVQTAGTGFKLRATTGALTAGLSTAFDVTAAAPTRLAFAAALPASVVAGVSIPFSVRELDPYGNLATTGTDTIVVAMAGGTPAVFGGASQQAASGVASFADVNVRLVGTGYELEATSGSLTAARSSAFNITSAPPAKLAFSGVAATLTAGEAQSFTVRELDAFDNLALTGTDTVDLALTRLGSPATFFGAGSYLAAGGIASVGDFAVQAAATTYVLEATSGSLGAATAGFDVIAAAPNAAHGTVTSVDASVAAGGTTSVTVTLMDLYDNPAPNALVSVGCTTGACTFTADSSGATTTSGTFTRTLGSTVAEDKVVTGYIENAHTALADTAAVTFTAGAPVAGQSSLAAGSPAYDDNQDVTLTLTLEDTYGNLVPLTAADLATDLGTLSATTVTTSASGVATATIRFTGQGTAAITAKIGADTIASLSLPVGEALASTTLTTFSLPGSPVIGDGIATAAVTVTVRDTGGRLMQGKTVSLTYPGGTASADVVTLADGVAGFTVTALARYADLTNPVTAHIGSVSVASLTNLVFTACPAGQEYCGGVCVDTQTSATNCGLCGTTCAGVLTCSEGKCGTACDVGKLTLPQARQSLLTGVSPRGVAAADFDGDGNVDLVTADFGPPYTLTLFLGAGDGTYYPQAPIALSAQPISLAVGDPNKDTNPDILVGYNVTNVELFLGDGAGSFGAPSSETVGSYPVSIMFALVNGDTNPDIITSDASSNTVSVLLGNGDGTFQARKFTGVTLPYMLAVGHINNDGILDFVVSSLAGTNQISIGLGAGDGTFPTVTTKTDVGFGPAGVVVADVNGDLSADVATANFDAGANSVSVLLNNGSGVLGSPAFYPVAASPWSLASGDLDGDGTIDLIAGDRDNATVSVLFGKPEGVTGHGDGTFGRHTLFNVGSSPYQLIVTNLTTGDTNLDVAVANYGSNSVSVLVGDGKGAFAGQSTFGAGSYPNSIAHADLNGDGIEDVVVTNRNSAKVSILLGNKNGTFQWRTQLDVGSIPLSVTAADVSGDGKLDLVVASQGGPSIGVLRGNGDGTFMALASTAVGDVSPVVVVTELSGDANPDIVVGGLGNTLSVLLGPPDVNGVFASGTCAVSGLACQVGGAACADASACIGAGHLYQYTIANTPIGFAVADLNNNGVKDIVTANLYGGSVTLLWGAGDGTFSMGGNLAAGAGSARVAVGNMNGDAYPDLVVVNEYAATVSVLLGSGVGTWLAKVDYPVGVDALSLNLVDLDKDSNTDVVTANYGGNSISVLHGTASGALQPQTTYTVGTWPTNVAAVDLDVNTWTDLVVSNEIDGTVTVLMNGASGLTGRVVAAAGSQPYGLALGRFNGDALLDATVANLDSATASVLLGTATPGFAAPSALTVGTSPTSVATGLVDAGSNVDIVTADKGSGAVTVLLGGGDGTFVGSSHNAGSAPHGVAMGLINGDANTDLAVTNNDAATVSVLLGDGAGGFGAPVPYTTGAGPRGVAVADLNYDGRNDLIVANATGGTLSVLLGNGTGFDPQLTFTVGNTPESVAAGRLNADGYPDVVVANSGTSTVSVLLNTATTSILGAATAVTVGAYPSSLSIADVDHDGKLDVVSANNGGTSLTVLQGKGDGTFTAAGFDLGVRPYAVAAGDVDGDGRRDLVVSGDQGVFPLISTCH